MRTISVRLDDSSEARLERLCQTLGLSQTDVVKAGLDLLQQHSTSPAALAEGLGLIGSFSSAAQEGGITSRGRDHSALLRQKLSRQQSQQRLSKPQP
jgi:Arc/MetJ-type ribon-helix-helix transcriptional regulator